jgi:hypothetical protein
MSPGMDGSMTGWDGWMGGLLLNLCRELLDGRGVEESAVKQDSESMWLANVWAWLGLRYASRVESGPRRRPGIDDRSTL